MSASLNPDQHNQPVIELNALVDERHMLLAKEHDAVAAHDDKTAAFLRDLRISLENRIEEYAESAHIA